MIQLHSAPKCLEYWIHLGFQSGTTLPLSQITDNIIWVFHSVFRLTRKKQSFAALAVCEGNHWCLVDCNVESFSISFQCCSKCRQQSQAYVEGILPKWPYPPCLRMAYRALLAGYPRCVHFCFLLTFYRKFYFVWAEKNKMKFLHTHVFYVPRIRRFVFSNLIQYNLYMYYNLSMLEALVYLVYAVGPTLLSLYYGPQYVQFALKAPVGAVYAIGFNIGPNMFSSML